MNSPTHKVGLVERRLESAASWQTATVVHLGIFMLVATWWFGSGSEGSRRALQVWGLIGAGLTLAAVLSGEVRRRGTGPRLRWLWPLAAFNGLAIAGLFFPTFREASMDGHPLLVPVEVSPWLPSAARPYLAAQGLVLLDGIFLSCFNLLLLVQDRRVLRRLLFFVLGNALLLSVFGSVQKFTGAKGLFFDLFPTRQVYFFSSFVYHNHWGAFIVLMTAAGSGLALRYIGRREYRSFWHSPAFSGVVALFFLVATVPLSGSRSSTLLVALLLLLAAAQGLRIIRRQAGARRRPLWSALALGVALLIGGAVIFRLAQPVIQSRVAQTARQIEQMLTNASIGSRSVLYADTWRMARDRLVFGWGTDSYPSVFYLYNSQKPNSDGLPVYYEDAHSDWLQVVAEHGLVGAALLAMLALVPLSALRRYRRPGPLPSCLLLGCGLIVLYALVEFPFGNAAVVFTWWLCLFAAVAYVTAPSRDASRREPAK